jgi:AcrR family transcriptional regulator
MESAVPANQDLQASRKILEAARDTILSRGLTGWTIDQVAEEAHCAKGLVLYHYRNKLTLLQAVADLVRVERAEARVGALSVPGAHGLDRLWETLAADWKSGRSALWLSLVANGDSRTAASLSEADRLRFSAAAVTALDLPADRPGLSGMLDSLIGFELSLIQGQPPADVRESFDRYWLGVITSGP